MFFYSNIPNRKQYLEQRLAIPAGFRSTVYTPNCQELEHENKPQKLIIFGQYPKKCVTQEKRVKPKIELQFDPFVKNSNKLIKNNGPVPNRHGPFFRYLP